MNDVAVPRAQFDLANMAAGRVCLFCDQGRAFRAAASLAARNVAARMNTNARRCGIKIRLKHASDGKVFLNWD